ncbi:MAG: 50S ribosomal protein L3, partial [Sphingomonas hengshuiensis]
ERGLIFIKGSVPGSKGGWLIVKDAVKIARPAEAPYPAAIKVAANSNQAADTPADEAPVADATDGQEG